MLNCSIFLPTNTICKYILFFFINSFTWSIFNKSIVVHVVYIQCVHYTMNVQCTWRRKMRYWYPQFMGKVTCLVLTGCIRVQNNHRISILSGRPEKFYFWSNWVHLRKTWTYCRCWLQKSKFLLMKTPILVNREDTNRCCGFCPKRVQHPQNRFCSFTTLVKNFIRFSQNFAHWVPIL